MSARHVLPSGFTAFTAEPAEDEAVLQFINRIQPHIAWTREHFEWQYRRHPAGPARLYVAREGARLVSLYAAVAQRLRHGGEVFDARMIQDVMTDPAYRGRGLLHHLAGMCHGDLLARGEGGYTFPNEASERSFRRTGWTELGPVPLCARAVTPADEDAISVLRLVPRFGPEAPAAWRDSGLAVGVERDGQYLEWRYAKPGQRYERHVVGDGGGYVILKHFVSESGPLTHICDVVVRADERRVLPDTLADCASIAARAGSRTLTAWLPAGHAYELAFVAAGFTSWSTNRFVFVMSAGRAAVGRASAWHLTQGDSDVY